MPVGKKLAVVASVMVAGVSVACFFRKDASRFGFWRTGPEDPFEHTVERRIVSDDAWPAGRAVSSSVQHAVRVPPATTAAITTPAAESGSEPTFQTSHNPVGTLLEPIDGIADEGDLERDDVSGPDGDYPRPGDPRGTRHTVIDGDTLTKIAVRYLGRADGVRQIFDLNRDVLRDPDLLPIGAVLKIPQRASTAVGEPSLGRPGNASATIPVQEPPLEMVPVPGQSAHSAYEPLPIESAR